MWALGILFILANVMVYNHAYRFTHFSASSSSRPKQPEDLSFGEKLNTLFFGVSVPKPKNSIEPSRPFTTFTLQSHEQLEGWKIPVAAPKGVVILFHGYISSKSQILDYAEAFNQKNYTTVLIDFMGSGGSGGLETTIGFKEGRDVKVVFDYVKKQHPNQQIVLFGCSMGAASIMKSIEQYNIKPDKIILECPFGTMLQSAKNRFEAMNIPATPFAHWLIFYGGLQTGFNAFEHNPENYAKKINIPTALFVGAKDARVTRAEIDNIYNNLNGEKALGIFENSAHQNYLTNDVDAWHTKVDSFLLK